MKRDVGMWVVFALGATILAACGGNVVVDGSGAGGSTGAGGAGGGADACEHYVDVLTAKYNECGLFVEGSGGAGSIGCGLAEEALAACAVDCVPLLECTCIKDPAAPGCDAKNQAYVDCMIACTP